MVPSKRKVAALPDKSLASLVRDANDHFSHGAAGFHVGDGLGRGFKRKDFVQDRLDDALFHQRSQVDRVDAGGAHAHEQIARARFGPRQLHHFHRSLVTTDGESFHANTEARCGDATGASSRRFLRMPASNAPAGANRRSNRRRVARPPAVYRSFGRGAMAASSTTSATTPCSSAVSRTALNCLLTVARDSRYSSIFTSGSSKFAPNCCIVYSGSLNVLRNHT